MNIRLKYALFCVFGLLLGVGGTIAGFQLRMMKSYKNELQTAQETIAQQQKVIAEEKTCAVIPDRQDNPVKVTQERWDTAQKAMANLFALYQKTTADLKEAQQNPAAQELARSGHVMNETQCRVWIAAMGIPVR